MTTKPSDEQRRIAALAYATRVRAHPAPCVYGHLECADHLGGRCIDELFSCLGLDNDGDWIEDERSLYLSPFTQHLLDSTGLVIYQTGGGCTALRMSLPMGQYILLTGADGATANLGDGKGIVIGFYDADGNALATFDASAI